MSLPVGERLKSARESKGLSLQEAAGITKIQRQTLEVIEQGRVHETLDPVYARIFVKKYAAFLGFDGAALADEYQGVTRATAVAEMPQSASAANQPASAAPSMNLLAPIGIVLAALIGIAFLGYMAVDLYHNLQRQKPAASAPAAAPKEKGPESQKLLVPLSKPLKLTVQTTADVWMQMKADGAVVFQNVLPKGSRESWPAKNDLEIWTGNAGAMQLFLNGKPLEGLGRGVRKGVKVTRAGLQG